MRCVIGLMKYFVLINLELEITEEGLTLRILYNGDKDKEIILQEWVLCFRTKKYSVCFLKLMLEVEKKN